MESGDLSAQAVFIIAPSMTTPLDENFQSATRSLRAGATIAVFPPPRHYASRALETTGSTPMSVGAAAITKPAGSWWIAASGYPTSIRPVRGAPIHFATVSAPARHRRPPAAGCGRIGRDIQTTAWR